MIKYTFNKKASIVYLFGGTKKLLSPDSNRSPILCIVLVGKTSKMSQLHAYGEKYQLEFLNWL